MAAECLPGSWGEDFVGPGHEVGDGELVVAEVVDAWLSDSHTDTVDAVLETELVVRAKCVDLHLRVLERGDGNALAILEVNDIHSAVGNDDGIGGAEGVGDVLAEVETCLDKELCVGGDGAGGIVLLDDYGCIGIGVLVHFAGVVVGKLGYLFVFVLGGETEEGFQFLGTVGMCECAFNGKAAAYIGHIGLEVRSGCAVEPARGAGG